MRRNEQTRIGLPRNPPLPYAYVRRAYGVNPGIGQRVRHTETGRLGTIAKPHGDTQYVRVRFDGDERIMNAHPTSLDYSPNEAT